jgi:hypothetical protein
MVLYPGEPFFLSESLVMYDCTCGQYKWKRLPRMPEAMYNGIGFALGSDLFVVAACWLVAWADGVLRVALWPPLFVVFVFRGVGVDIPCRPLTDMDFGDDLQSMPRTNISMRLTSAATWELSSIANTYVVVSISGGSYSWEIENVAHSQKFGYHRHS